MFLIILHWLALCVELIEHSLPPWYASASGMMRNRSFMKRLKRLFPCFNIHEPIKKKKKIHFLLLKIVSDPWYRSRFESRLMHYYFCESDIKFSCSCMKDSHLCCSTINLYVSKQQWLGYYDQLVSDIFLVKIKSLRWFLSVLELLELVLQS